MSCAVCETSHAVSSPVQHNWSSRRFFLQDILGKTARQEPSESSWSMPQLDTFLKRDFFIENLLFHRARKFYFSNWARFRGQGHSSLENWINPQQRPIMGS